MAGLGLMEWASPLNGLKWLRGKLHEVATKENVEEVGGEKLNAVLEGGWRHNAEPLAGIRQHPLTTLPGDPSTRGSRISEDSFAVVFQGMANEKLYAIKFYKAHGGIALPSYIKAEKEVKLCMQCRDIFPDIRGIFLGDDTLPPALVMDLASETLEQEARALLPDGSYRLKGVRLWLVTSQALQLCANLSMKGLVHADIKPSKLLADFTASDNGRTDALRLKFRDLGLLRAVDEELQEVLAGSSNIHGNIAALVPEYYTEGMVRSTTDLPAMATLLWMLLHDSLEPFDAYPILAHDLSDALLYSVACGSVIISSGARKRGFRNIDIHREMMRICELVLGIAGQRDPMLRGHPADIARVISAAAAVLLATQKGQEEVERATLILGCLQVYGMVPRLPAKHVPERVRPALVHLHEDLSNEFAKELQDGRMHEEEVDSIELWHCPQPLPPRLQPDEFKAIFEQAPALASRPEFAEYTRPLNCCSAAPFIRSLLAVSSFYASCGTPQLELGRLIPGVMEFVADAVQFGFCLEENPLRVLEVQKAKCRLQDLQGQLDQLSKEENRQRQLAAAARCRKQALAALERLRDLAAERELLLQAITQAHGTVQKAQAVAAQAAAKAAATGKQLSPNAPWCELTADGVGELLADHVSGLLRALHAGLFPHQAPPGGAVGRRTFELMLGQIIPALQPALPAPQLGVPDDLRYLEVTAAALLGIREQAARVLELCEEVYRGKDSDVVMMPATLISFGDVQLQLLLATLENAHPRPADRELMSKRVAMMGAAAAAAIQSLTRVPGKAEQSLPALLTVLASTSRQAAEARQAELLAGGPLLPPQGMAQQADQQGLQLLQQVPAAGKGLPLQQQEQLQDSPSAAAVVAEPPSTRRSAEEVMGILLGAEGPSTAAQGGQAGALLARLADKMQLRLLPTPSSQLPVWQAVTRQARHSWMWQAPLNHQARHAAAAEGRSRPSAGSAVACDLDNQRVPRENQCATEAPTATCFGGQRKRSFAEVGASRPVWQSKSARRLGSLRKGSGDDEAAPVPAEEPRSPLKQQQDCGQLQLAVAPARLPKSSTHGRRRLLSAGGSSSSPGGSSGRHLSSIGLRPSAVEGIKALKDVFVKPIEGLVQLTSELRAGSQVLARSLCFGPNGLKAQCGQAVTQIQTCNVIVLVWINIDFF